MSAVTISPKFQVVIPRQIREEMHLKAGQKVEIIRYENRIELIPIRPIKELRGILKGMGVDSDIPRDEDRL